MKSAPSWMKLLLTGFGVTAMVASCTIEAKTGTTCTAGTFTTCACDGAVTGQRSCNSDGTFGVCVCDQGSGGSGGSSAMGGSATSGGAEASGGSGTSGGTTSSGGAATGGSSTGGAIDQAGAGGAGGATFDSCDTCLADKCQAEFDACLADTTCVADPGSSTLGQYEQIASCLDTIRITRAVKRQDLRDCGAMVDGGTGFVWPPPEMNEVTLNLVNCMATGLSGEVMNNTWADAQNITNVWPPASCAKLACSSQL
jgi:hypothetical protein